MKKYLLAVLILSLSASFISGDTNPELPIHDISKSSQILPISSFPGYIMEFSDTLLKIPGKKENNGYTIKFINISKNGINISSKKEHLSSKNSNIEFKKSVIAGTKFKKKSFKSKKRPQKRTEDTDSKSYSGNFKSRIFHDSTCRHYDCKNCTAQFSSRQQAVNKGYRPCKKCRP